MVLLENFGAEPLTVKPMRSNCYNFVCLLPLKVTQIMMPGIPKFGKRTILKGPTIKRAIS